MSPFDEDPSENRSELELCIDEIHQLQAENEHLRKRIDEAISVLPTYPGCAKQCLIKALKEVKP